MGVSCPSSSCARPGAAADFVFVVAALVLAGVVGGTRRPTRRRLDRCHGRSRHRRGVRCPRAAWIRRCRRTTPRSGPRARCATPSPGGAGARPDANLSSCSHRPWRSSWREACWKRPGAPGVGAAVPPGRADHACQSSDSPLVWVCVGRPTGVVARMAAGARAAGRSGAGSPRVRGRRVRGRRVRGDGGSLSRRRRWRRRRRPEHTGAGTDGEQRRGRDHGDRGRRGQCLASFHVLLLVVGIPSGGSPAIYKGDNAPGMKVDRGFA